ncbi:MAK10-like protein [Tanacetum coccineum]
MPTSWIIRVHQLETFLNALNSNDQDSLNSTAGGNFLDKMPRDCLRIIGSKSKVRNSRNKPIVAKVSSSSSTTGISPDVVELKDMVKSLLLEKKNQNQAPTLVKAVEERLGNSNPFETLANLGSCVNIILLYLFKKLNIGLLEETGHIFGLADRTKSYPIGIVKDVEVHIGKLKLLNDFYIIVMKKDLETPLLIGRGFLATANAVIDYRMANIAVGERITRSVFGVKGVDLGEKEVPYWTTLGKRESYKPCPGTDRCFLQIKLHLERKMEFDQWKSKNFKGKHPALVKVEGRIDDEGEVTKFLIKNEEEIFTDAGDEVRIYPDGVASLVM